MKRGESAIKQSYITSDLPTPAETRLYAEIAEIVPKLVRSSLHLIIPLLLASGHLSYPATLTTPGTLTTPATGFLSILI